VPFHLLDETLPFIRVVSSNTWSLLSPDDYESGEPIIFGETPLRHEVFTFCDHLQLRLVNELHLPLHATFIALTDDSDDKVHEDNVPDNQDDEPEEPCEDLEFFGAVNDWWGVVVADWLAQYNHEISYWLNSVVGLSRFNHYDKGHHSEANDHKKEEEEKDKNRLYNIDQHFHQEANFRQDSYQKAELEESQYHNEQL
jgi:hypothetical protein